jgi:hypothetical protein
MTPKQRRAELARLIRLHRLSTSAVADLVIRSPRTVRTWRQGTRTIPRGSLALLILRLVERAA